MATGSGVDGSRSSLAAVEFAAQLAERLDVGITAVFAFDPLVEWVPEMDPSSWRSKAQAAVRRWTTAVKQVGVPLEIEVDRDVNEVGALARAVERHPGAVVCVGGRGLGEITESRRGRVPLELLHHTGAAVVVVPLDDHSPARP